jgi:hypothetical protein
MEATALRGVDRRGDVAAEDDPPLLGTAVLVDRRDAESSAFV